MVGPTRRGKGTKIMVLTDGEGVPLAVDIGAANHAEVNLIEPLLDEAVSQHVRPGWSTTGPPTAIRCEGGSPSVAWS